MRKPMHNVVWTESERYPRREFTYQEVDGLAVCRKCHAVHRDKHWVFDDETARSLLEQPSTQQVVCPGCNSVLQKSADGVLTLCGALVREKRDEIENLVRAEEKLEMAKNPLGRIIYIERHADVLEIATTTQFLARHIGRRVQKAFGGELNVDHLPRREFVRVRWFSPFSKR